MTTAVATPPNTDVALFNNVIEKSTLPVVITENLTLDDKTRQSVDLKKANLRKTPTTGIVLWGNEEQKPLDDISKKMIEGVRNKDVADPVKGALNQMVLAARSFDVGDLKGDDHPGFFARMIGKVAPIVAALQRYEKVDSQINVIITNLDRQIGILMKDVYSFDAMYEQTLKSFHGLKVDIQALEEYYNEIMTQEVPALQAKLTDDPETSLALNSVQERARKIERRIDLLKKTRIATLGFLPTIRGIQDAGTSLVEGAQTGISTMIPLWRQEIAMLLGSQRVAEAGEVVGGVYDFTNQMLEKGSEMMREQNAKVRERIEQNTIDTAAIKKANDNFIGMLMDNLSIYEKYHEQRQKDVVVIDACEQDMRKALEASIVTPGMITQQ